MVFASAFRTAFVAAATIVLLAGAAPGAGATMTEGDAPKGGFVDSPSVVPVGWTGPLTVGWLNHDDSQTFRVVVTGPDGYASERDLWIPEGTSVRRPVSVDPIEAPGSYRAAFLDGEGDTVVDHDLTAVTPVELQVAGAAPTTFLPRVRDGIRDSAQLRFSVDRPAQVTGRVVDRRGRVLQVVDLGTREPGVTHSWSWYGRARGVPVERGRYALRLTARSDRLDVTRSREVRVASYRVPVQRAVRRLGAQTADRSPGGCRLSSRAGGALHVDCQDAARGEAASVTWRFWPGRSAGRVRWDLEGGGVATGPDQIRMFRHRAGDAMRVVLRVRPGAAYRVEKVRVAYRVLQQR